MYFEDATGGVGAVDRPRANSTLDVDLALTQFDPVLTWC